MTKPAVPEALPGKPGAIHVGVSLRRIPENIPGAGIPVVKLLYTADPTMTPEKLAVLRSKYASEARFRREMLVEYEALEGTLVYPEFSRDRNLCEPFDVSDPEYWTIWMACDSHSRTAHAMVWEAFNKHGDRVVCGEFWPEIGTPYSTGALKASIADPEERAKVPDRYSVRDYAEAIQLFESDSELKPPPFQWANGKRLRIFRRLMDTYGKGVDAAENEDFFEAYRRIGLELSKTAGNNNQTVNLYFAPALKGHDNLAKAQDSIGQALRPSQQGPPRLHVFADCYETIDEFENVRYPRPTRKPGDDFGKRSIGRA